MKIKTSELEGPALDWAVGMALGWKMRRVPNDIDGQNGGEVLAAPELSSDFQFPQRGKVAPWYFVRCWSTDWSQGGPLIEKYKVGISCGMSGKWCAVKGMPRYANTPLIAAMRAIVSAELGDVVDVPDELAP